MSASVVRRETLIRAGGFCPMQSYTEDWTMFVNVARLTEWHTLPRRLGFTRLHIGQSSADMSNVISVLCGQVNAWYGGRPMPHRTRGLDMVRELKTYGTVYRAGVQGYLWNLIWNGHFRLAAIVYRLGWLLCRTAPPRVRPYTAAGHLALGAVCARAAPRQHRHWVSAPVGIQPADDP